jgi:hypothetical protein
MLLAFIRHFSIPLFPASKISSLAASFPELTFQRIQFCVNLELPFQSGFFEQGGN